MKHLTPLTSLRFFAAFVVVLCHVRYAHERELPWWLWNFTKNGFVGVNLFFVLSGFVIAYNYGQRFLDRSTGYWQFMLARFARIWPAFLTALIFAFPVYVLREPESLRKFPLMLPAHLTLTHNWFPNLGEAWLFPSWTIGTEWGFYLLFPLFGAAVFRLRERGLWALLLGSAAVAFVAPALYHSGALRGLDLTGGSPTSVPPDAFMGRVLRWYSIVRLPEFLVGVCVCRLFMLQTEAQRAAWGRAMGPVALVSLLLVVGLMALDPLPLMFTNQAALTLPFAAILWFLAYQRGLAARWMAVPWLVLLGEASYSLYLIHPVVKQAVLITGRKVLGMPESSFLLSGLVVVLSIGVSLLMFRFIEAPARRWIVGRFGPKRRVVVAAPVEEERAVTSVAPKRSRSTQH